MSTCKGCEALTDEIERLRDVLVKTTALVVCGPGRRPGETPEEYAMRRRVDKITRPRRGGEGGN